MSKYSVSKKSSKKLKNKSAKKLDTLKDTQKKIDKIITPSLIFTKLPAFCIGAAIFYYIHYTFIMNQEVNECECATNNWMHTHLKTYVKVQLYIYAFLTLFFLLLVFLIKFHMFKTLLFVIIPSSLTLFALSIYTLISNIILIMYLYKLYEEDCDCSNTWRKYVIITLNVVNLLILLVSLFIK